MANSNNTLETTDSREPVAFDDRTRRVMELRKQIREGTYRSDPRKIAEAILDEWIAFGDVAVRDEELPTVESSADRKAVGKRFVVAPGAPEANESRVIRTA
jgi:hypothetical protein